MRKHIKCTGFFKPGVFTAGGLPVFDLTHFCERFSILHKIHALTLTEVLAKFPQLRAHLNVLSKIKCALQ